MKKNNKSWIRQLSESYIRQTLNENNELHQAADDIFSYRIPKLKGQFKAYLGSHKNNIDTPTEAVHEIFNHFAGHDAWEEYFDQAHGGSRDNWIDDLEDHIAGK